MRLRQTTSMFLVTALTANGLLLPLSACSSSPSSQTTATGSDPSSAPSAGTAPQGASGQGAAATVMPPNEPSREELTKNVADLAAKLSQAATASTRTALPDARTRLDALFDGLSKIQKLIPRDHFDPSAIVAEVGKDPASLGQWVRDHTALVPYRGTLRGPVGVLMDRMGNSLDRALLLHELLRLAGFQPRLARARLTGAALETVAAAADRPQPSDAVTAPSDAAVADIAMAAGVGQAAVGPQQAALRDARAQLVDRVAARASHQAAALVGVVRPQIKTASADPAAQRRDALSDHWWVQYRDGASWTNLDPLPGSDSLGALATPGSTMTASGLPDTIFHRVRVRVMAEFWKDGALKATPVLDHVFAPSQWIGQPIALHSSPVNWPPEKTLTAAPDRLKALRDAALAQHEWIPSITIGTKSALKYSFTDDGQLLNVADPHALSMRLGRNVSKLTSRVDSFSNMLSGLPKGSAETTTPAPAAPRPAVLTAEWVEYEVIVPGARPEKARRDVFDLLSPQARAAAPVARPELTERQKLDRAWALLGETQLLAPVAKMPAEYVADLTASRVLAARTFLTGVLTGAVARDAAPPLNVIPTPGPLYLLATARITWSGVRDRVYFDRPNLLTYRTTLAPDPKGDARSSEWFDIVSNYVAVRPSASAADAFATRVEQGVADTNAETIVLGECDTCGEPSENAAELFAAAGTQKRAWTVVPSAAALQANATLTDSARNAIGRDLAAGAIVVAQPEAVTRHDRQIVTWWKTDSQTGQTVGMGERGGQELAEYMMMLNLVDSVVCMVKTEYKYDPGFFTFDGRGDSPQIESPGHYLAAGLCVAGLMLGTMGYFAVVEYQAVKALGYVIGTLSLILSQINRFTS